jgi:hypothetical protein
MATLAPVRTLVLPRTYWTIHSKPNRAFSMLTNQCVRTSLMGFYRREDAQMVGSMIETHVARQKSWPSVNLIDNALWLPAPTSTELNHLYLCTWSYEDIKLLCTRNMLDLITVEAITRKANGEGYSLSGSSIHYEATTAFYQERFDELFGMNA